VKKNKDCKVQMSVEVEADTVEARYQDVLRDFQRQARLPGFREGKAPADLVEKRYAEQAREELLKSLIPEVYHQSVRSQKVAPVCLPKISGVQYARGKKLSFSAEFEEAPVVNVKHYKGIALKREQAAVDAGEVEKALQSLAESRAQFTALEEARAVLQGDVVVVDIELWQDGQYVRGRGGVLLSVEPGDEDDFFAKIVGASAGQTKEILKGGQPFSRVSLKEIRKKVLPEIGDAFAKSLGRENLESLRETLRKDIASYKHSQSLEKMRSELFAKLLALVSFPVPESLVEKQKERLLSDTRSHYERLGMPAEQWKQEAARVETEAQARAQDQIKLYFILQKVAALENIEPDEIELEGRLRTLAEQSKRPIEEVRRVFEEDLRDSLREKKTVDFLIANAKFEEEQRRAA
jgi:trigger factor